MQSELSESLTTTINATIGSIIVFLPKFIFGLIVVLLGIIIASFLKQILLELLKFLKIESALKKYGIPEAKEGVNWATVLAELLRWFIVILFLVPAADIWGLGKFVEVLNGLLLFLPNVIVAVLILLVGFIVSKLVHDLLLASIHGVSREIAQSVATVGRWSVMVFVFLIVLNQLGIASDLIRILFAGLVAMLAIAGGLAFGLGGKDMAKELLDRLVKKL